ncbi:hypothetical protein [Metabacillus litoralis]|nr:hypothetical protein [Metabacillus litoralis]
MSKEREMELSPTALNPLIGFEINEENEFVNEPEEQQQNEK